MNEHIPDGVCPTAWIRLVLRRCSDLGSAVLTFFAFLCSRCTAISHVPNVEGLFVAAHSDGNLYVYDKVSHFQLFWFL